MAYVSFNERGYTPNARSRKILDRAWEHVQGVDYEVTARWLFYRLLQDGFYATKTDYNGPFMQLLSRVRHNEWGPWRPDSLVDDRREAIVRGDGFKTPDDWLDAVTTGLGCDLSHWHEQSYYVEVWFEAGAMRSQFEHYVDNVTLVPFGGMPSIFYKHEIAKRLEQASAEYEHAIKVLYFGDLDPAGELIPETSVADIRKWCPVPFEFIRAGLNPGDEIKYGIPENFDHPGAFQWEALDDEAAAELITSAVSQYVDMNIVSSVAARAEDTAKKFREHARRFALPAGESRT